jgi:hypothetical protein
MTCGSFLASRPSVAGHIQTKGKFFFFKAKVYLLPEIKNLIGFKGISNWERMRKQNRS